MLPEGQHTPLMRVDMHCVSVVPVCAAAAETSVAVASTSPQDPDSDKVLTMSARMLAESSAFVAAASRTSSPPEQLHITSRLRALLSAAARLTRLAAARPPPAMSSSSGQHHHPAWIHHPIKAMKKRAQRGAGGGVSASDSPRFRLSRMRSDTWPSDTKQAADSSYINTLEGTAAAAAGPVTEIDDSMISNAVQSELDHPWAWDVTQPLTQLSGGLALRHMTPAPGLGAHYLCRAAAEMCCEALAAAWQEGKGAAVRSLLVWPQAVEGAEEQMVGLLGDARLLRSCLLWSAFDLDNCSADCSVCRVLPRVRHHVMSLAS